MIQFSSNYLLNGFVVLLVLVIAWFFLKHIASIVIGFGTLVGRILAKVIGRNQKNLHVAKSGATRIKEELPKRIVEIDSRAMQTQPKNLASVKEAQDWTLYETPTYVRKGIVFH